MPAKGLQKKRVCPGRTNSTKQDRPVKPFDDVFRINGDDQNSCKYLQFVCFSG